MKTRTTWREKLEKDQPPVVKPTPKGMMLIPRPLSVDALMCRVGEGKLATLGQIRDHLARDCGADYTCPMTTGIFMWIASEAAEEDLGRGMTIGQVTPYWRVIKDDGSLNPKFPGGVATQATHLTREGHAVLPPTGKKPPRSRTSSSTYRRCRGGWGASLAAAILIRC